MFTVRPAERLKALPPYLFKEIDALCQEARARGVDIIDLGVGDPDTPTPEFILKALVDAVPDPANHQYPSYVGMKEFRAAVAEYYQKRHDLNLDPNREVLTLIGSKEGIAHLPLAFINPGDVALVPEPGYPVYHIGTMFAGGSTHFMPLLEKNAFLPDLDAIPPDLAERARLLFVNYPNNPTGAVAGLDFYEKAVAYAKKHDIILVSDAAYSELAYDGYQPPSVLSVPGAMDVAVEVNSLSKTYNMTGYRIAWAAGRAEIVDALGRVKSNIDSGAYQAVQQAGIAALRQGDASIRALQEMYRKRRDVFVKGLNEAGITVAPPKATFYLWVKAPAGTNSATFAKRLLTEAGIVGTPGNGFGPSGEGYVRFTLTQDEQRLAEAANRIKAIGF